MIKKYFNSKAAIWDEEVAEKDTVKLSTIAARLHIEEGATVLDVGTGTGVFIPYLQKYMGENGLLIAMDIAENMLYRSLIKHPEGTIMYLQSDITYTPLIDAQFDAVVCYSSFPHFQDKRKALSEIARVLRNGGRLYICHTSSRDTINGIHQQIPGLEKDTIPDPEEMCNMLMLTGFRDIAIDEDNESYLVSASKP
jgi:demethylmenaquinone methyltransferase/2-methoxy-6-polyprenyl-1,4-benzoquinol methylase